MRGDGGKLAGAAALVLLIAAAPADPIRIGPPRVQLFYEYSGTLSANIAPPAKFNLWNVGAGEGSARESARDALVTVPVTMPPADMALFTKAPLSITVRNAAGRIVGQRSYPAERVMVPVTGKAFANLWLNDIQCAGKLRIEARYGAQSTRTELNFACGE